MKKFQFWCIAFYYAENLSVIYAKHLYAIMIEFVK